MGDVVPIKDVVNKRTQPHIKSPKTGGGNGGPTVDTETQRYVDAKTEATRAQNDARFAEVITKLDTLKETLPSKSQIWGMYGIWLATGFALIAFIFLFFQLGLGEGKENEDIRNLIEKNAVQIEKLTDIEGHNNESTQSPN